ncbi:MAG: hypothetical protein V1696_00875 [Candidatus Jorgensenbacteria bacterium]
MHKYALINYWPALYLPVLPTLPTGRQATGGRQAGMALLSGVINCLNFCGGPSSAAASDGQAHLPRIERRQGGRGCLSFRNSDEKLERRRMDAVLVGFARKSLLDK